MADKKRTAIRAIILSPQNSVLLIQMQEPSSKQLLWLTPGGGLESGEKPAACLQRELAEETGLTNATIGPQIWTRHHQFTWGQYDVDQIEHYYLVETDIFEPSMVQNPHAGEKDWFRGFRWWHLDEIIASNDIFSPRQFGKHLKQLVTEGPPEQPIDVGI